MEMVLEFRGRSAEADDFVGEQVGLDRRDAVALDPLHRLESPQQIDETLSRRAPEIAGIHPRHHDFPLSGGGDAVRLVHQHGDGRIAACAAGIVDGAVGALVVAAVLHLEESPRTVAARESREKAGQLLGGATVNPGRSFARKRRHATEKVALVVVPQHEIDPFDGGDLLRPELGVASRHGDDGRGITTVEPADQVAALFVGMFGYRAGVHHADIGLLLRPDPHIAPFGKFACEGRGFGKVELAPEGVKTDAAFHDDCFFGRSVSETYGGQR